MVGPVATIQPQRGVHLCELGRLAVPLAPEDELRVIEVTRRSHLVPRDVEGGVLDLQVVYRRVIEPVGRSPEDVPFLSSWTPNWSNTPTPGCTVSFMIIERSKGVA